ncbi:unnamed protein product [Pleuronectes platessa]|uniref:Uncharacterized protein n=1 Tax=Pleuronectes platessa TaxID=8262 RepID=A0A9N7UHA3_PLEPL|nr:unnamed protein product [Pleuronectes platessa]CAB1431435.1 unnamed protein product [Pleuronectes platessa]CAB1445386.1 unnamed protein product [Pleuronectes platessa]
MQGLRPESRIVSALRSIWFPTSTLPRRQEDNQNNTRLHQKRMFHSQEPRLHNNLFQLITFQTRNSSLHLAPDKQAIWTGTGSSPNRELLK